MKIHIENQILEFENNTKEIENILGQIDNIIAKSSKILDHMVINSFEVYQDFYNYFLDNIKEMQDVKVITLTYKELVQDILVSTMDYIERISKKIEELANTFYTSPDSDSWSDLNDLLGGISWIMNTFVSIDGYSRLKDVVLSYEDWNLYAREIFSLKEILPELESALSSNDNVSIADIISYEILPVFKEMAYRLSLLLKIGQLNDLS